MRFINRSINLLNLAIFAVATVAVSTAAWASPTFSLQGRIVSPGGTALEAASVEFRVRIVAPDANACVLYEETQIKNMTGSGGLFNIALNDGSGTRNDGLAHPFEKTFSNQNAFSVPSAQCSSGSGTVTYTPSLNDERVVYIFFRESGAATWEQMPGMTLAHSSYAFEASEASKVGGFGAANMCRVVDGSNNPVSVPALTSTQFNELLNVAQGSYTKASSNGASIIPSISGNPGSGLAAGQMWYDSTSQTLKYYDGAVKTLGTGSGAVSSIASGTGLLGGPITSSGTLSVDVGTTAGKIVQVQTGNKLPAIDGSALTNLNANNIASGTLPISRGGTGASTKTAAFDALSPNTTKGDVIVFNGTNNIRLGVGSDGQVLTADSSQASGVKWSAVSSGSLTNVTAGTGLLVGATAGGSITSTGTLNIDVGTGANQIVQLTAASKLPAVDGSLLTNLNGAQINSGTLPVSRGGTGSAAALANNKVMVSSGGAIVEGYGYSTSKAASSFILRDASGNFGAATGILDSLKLSGATSGTLTFTVPATVTSYTLNWPAATGAAGEFLSTDGSGNLTWSSPSGASDASYSAKGIFQADTDAATSGLSFSSSGVLKVNFGTGANQIVKLDASSKLPAVDGSALTNLNANNIFSGTLPISRGGTGASTKTTAFDALSPNTTKGDVIVYNGTNNIRLAVGSDGQVLTADSSQASGVKWSSVSTGSVTSLTAGTGLLVGASAGGSITSSGTLNIDVGTGASQIVQLTAASKLPAVDGSLLTNLSASQISAGTLPISRGGTGTVSLAANRLVGTNGTGTAQQAVTCSLNQLISFDSSGNYGCYDVTTIMSGSYFTNGGNSFGSSAIIGTSDNYSLTFRTNNSSRMIIDTSGNVGIGTLSPGQALDVVGTVNSSAGFAVGGAGSGIAFSGSALTGSNSGQFSIYNNSSNAAAYTSLTGGKNAASHLDLASTSVVGTSDYIRFFTGNSSERMRIDTSGNVGIGTSSPGSALDVKGVFRLSGATSGYNGFQAAATAGNIIWTLPTADGASGQFLKTDGSGNLSWASVASGDGSYSAKGILQVDTDAATSGLAFSSSGVVKVNAGTGANQILKLDSSSKIPAVDGSLITNMSLSQITMGTLSIARGGTNSGAALNNNRIMVSSGGAIVEAGAMTNGQLLIGSSGAAPVVAGLSSSNGISITTGAGSISIATNATSSNTVSTIVSRDTNGDFSARDISVRNISSSGTVSMTGDLSMGAMRATKQVSAASYSGASDAIDWNNGNVQTTSSNCQALSFTNMQDGGSYTLVVTEAGTTGCAFPASINGGTAVSWRGQPTLAGHTRTSSSHTVYTMLRVGSNIYVSWISGF